MNTTNSENDSRKNKLRIVRNINSSYKVQDSMNNKQQSRPVMMFGSEGCVMNLNEDL